MNFHKRVFIEKILNAALIYYLLILIYLLSQIANLVTIQGEDRPKVRNVMTLNSCSPIVGVDVMSFESEREVLLAWRVWSLTLKFIIKIW